MIRKHKALGLALLALSAFGAIGAQSASATPLTVPSVPVGGTVFITGTTDASSLHSFVLEPGLALECTHALYKGSAIVEAGNVVKELTLSPEYTGCKAFGFASADVKTSGCIYTLTTPTFVKAGEVTWGKEQIHVLCEGTKKIEVTPTSFGVSVCTTSIASQTPGGGHLVARNHGTATEMTLTDEATVEGVTYTSTGSACGKGGSTAKFVGNTTATCYSNEVHTIKTSCTFS
jgi:hypothetical protein